tara:strand:+ start:34 stop:675 length:642 start_codon:yes stop_codon:yes gene_type:complete
MNNIINAIKLSSAIEEAFADSGQAVQLSHFYAFSYICYMQELGDVISSDLQKIMSLNQPKIHRIIKSMKFAGLIRCNEYHLDERQVQITLTDRGLLFKDKVLELLSSSDAARPDIKMLNVNNLKIVKGDILGSGALKSNGSKIKTILFSRGECVVEVGTNYIKTNRGIVTLFVMLKRSCAKSVNDMIDFISELSEGEFDKFFTPNKRAGGKKC